MDMLICGADPNGAMDSVLDTVSPHLTGGGGKTII